jgi:hypothetical protein
MKPELIIALKSREGLESLNDLKAATDNGKLLDVEIKPHRERRSLDANAFLWITLSKMAAALKTSKDDLYLIMLERYGVFTHIIVKKEAVERVKSEWRTVRELGEGKIGTGTGVQLQVYYGSSTYDTKEMSHLLDGIVSEAHEIGIETPTRAELELMKTEWRRDK